MATETTAAALKVAGVERRHLVRSKALADYWELTKPEVNFLIAIITFASAWLVQLNLTPSLSCCLFIPCSVRCW